MKIKTPAILEHVGHSGKNTMVLNGWKEIAQYMGRGVRTAQRWEVIGLPIRRPHGQIRSAVIAVPAELDEWLSTRALRPASLPATPATNVTADFASRPDTPSFEGK